MIYDIVKRGESLAHRKADVIDNIIKSGIYRPELLNRFDGVILFHPIDNEALRKIAKLMLGGLKKRLAEKSYDLVINEPLIDYLVIFGADPKFGARPMNRAIQDNVEKIIAEKIIGGELRAGQKIELSQDDFR